MQKRMVEMTETMLGNAFCVFLLAGMYEDFVVPIIATMDSSFCGWNGGCSKQLSPFYSLCGMQCYIIVEAIGKLDEGCLDCTALANFNLFCCDQ